MYYGVDFELKKKIINISETPYTITPIDNIYQLRDIGVVLGDGLVDTVAQCLLDNPSIIFVSDKENFQKLTFGTTDDSAISRLSYHSINDNFSAIDLYKHIEFDTDYGVYMLLVYEVAHTGSYPTFNYLYVQSDMLNIQTKIRQRIIDEFLLEN